jgi:hypothetical protein
MTNPEGIADLVATARRIADHPTEYGFQWISVLRQCVEALDAHRYCVSRADHEAGRVEAFEKGRAEVARLRGLLKRCGDDLADYIASNHEDVTADPLLAAIEAETGNKS